MKTELEQQDIDLLSDKVIEKLQPILLSKHETEDIIFTPETLAEYLQVDTSWVYKQVSLRTIPFFKAGKYTRFRKLVIEKWIEKNMQTPLSPIRFSGGR